LLCLTFAGTAAAQSTTTVPFEIEEVSADGLTAVGWTYITYNVSRGYIWTNDVVSEIFVPNMGSTVPLAVSGDGRVVVGYAQPAPVGGAGYRAWTWNASTGVTIMSLPGHTSIRASNVSRDGTVFCGYAPSATGAKAFTWTPTGGGVLANPGPCYTSYLHWLNADGTRGVGSGAADVGLQTMLWSNLQQAGVQLGLAPGDLNNTSNAATPDTSVIVGHLGLSTQRRCMVWTADQGFQALPFEGSTAGELFSITDDGTTAVGYVVQDDVEKAVVWRRGHGLMLAEDFFQLHGLGTGSLRRVMSVSANGRVFGARGLAVNTSFVIKLSPCGSADFNHDGDSGTDQDIEAFFTCLAGNCCPLCDSADFNYDGDTGTDQDIESFFRVLSGAAC